MVTDHLIEIICKALCSIDYKFFRLQTTYEPSGIVRERVFCYELYHQIRLELDNDDCITLNGEIDKRGHVDFADEDRVNPDFVFHIPGIHEGNTIICEVKGVLDRSGIVKDFRTLSTFISKYNYKAGVFILYNHTIEELRIKLIERLSHFIESHEAENIYIIAIPKAGNLEAVVRLCDL